MSVVLEVLQASYLIVAAWRVDTPTSERQPAEFATEVRLLDVDIAVALLVDGEL
jgi:hypothetical protein